MVLWDNSILDTLPKTNIAMENGPFENVFPIKMGIFHCYVSVPEGSPPISKICQVYMCKTPYLPSAMARRANDMVKGSCMFMEEFLLATWLFFGDLG